MAAFLSRLLNLSLVLAMLGITQCESPTEAEEFTCAGKKFCSEMASCAEARFYLEQCGVTTMDGDKDGVPCEVEHCHR